jgi:hypothetical protein
LKLFRFKTEKKEERKKEKQTWAGPIYLVWVCGGPSAANRGPAQQRPGGGWWLLYTDQLGVKHLPQFSMFEMMPGEDITRMLVTLRARP